MQGGKFDLAQELCKKAIKYNKSCAKVKGGLYTVDPDHVSIY
jgi:hypothetical protein